MAFCPNCGAQVEGRFCAKCGSAVGSGTTAEAPPPPPPPSSSYSSSVPGAQPYVVGPATGGLTENLAAALCYLVGLITGILFLVLAPYNQSKFVRFHAFQSIFFHVAWIVTWIVFSIVLMIFRIVLHFAFLGLISSLINLVLYALVGLGGFLLWLFLMYKAYNNERFKLPIIGDLAEKQA